MATPLRNTITWDRTDPRAARRAIRSGGYTGYTAAIAAGYVQANICILPRDWSADFLLYCQRNSKPCPLIARSDPGDPGLPALAEDLDIRTDIPRYHIFRDGEFAEEVTDITGYWRDDLVTFALGCSFSFEDALMQDGMELRHITCGTTVPMYRTSVPTTPAGPFHGPLVVSMRPLKPADAIRAIQITTRFPAVHGAPVHIGKPELIGIQDIDKPDYGERAPMKDDEIPVFWACGVTPQSVVATVKPEFCITHYPGCMLVTDRKNSEFAIM